MLRASLRLAMTGLLLAVSGLSQQQMTVDKLVQFITSSVSQKLPDADVAKYVARLQMSERLDPRVIEQLQGKGAGSKTVAALNKLAEASASLSGPVAKAPPPPPKVMPSPPYEEQNQILSSVREYALNYSKSLPDFIGLQVTLRYIDRNYKSGTEGSWAQSDRISAKLSYFDQHEKYELLTANDNPMVGKSLESLDGAVSTGEFGSVMAKIFDPASSAEFHWQRWGTLRGQLCHVFSYVIDQPHSTETIDYNKGEARATPGYHGLIYVPKGTDHIVRVTVEPDIAAGFPLQEVHQFIDYENTEISGQMFLLPSRAQVIMRHDRMGSKNDIQFRAYRKYSADTSIKFDDADDPSQDDHKEEPATTPTTPPAQPPTR